jgi:hypothetical protein
MASRAAVWYAIHDGDDAPVVRVSISRKPTPPRSAGGAGAGEGPFSRGNSGAGGAAGAKVRLQQHVALGAAARAARDPLGLLLAAEQDGLGCGGGGSPGGGSPATDGGFGGLGLCHPGGLGGGWAGPAAAGRLPPSPARGSPGGSGDLEPAARSVLAHLAAATALAKLPRSHPVAAAGAGGGGGRLAGGRRRGHAGPRQQPAE